MRKPSRREWALLALVPVVGVLAAGVDPAETWGLRSVEPPQQEARAPAVERRAADKPLPELIPLAARNAAADEPGNIFQSKSWYVPPPPPPPPSTKPVEPPKPVAPPLPFTYLGRFQDAANPVIFLVKGDRILMVKAGDVIEGTYRVDGIAGARLGLTYLPLNHKHTLDIGPAG